MRRRSKRHPVLETAVFAAALLLSAFIARELWQRRTAAPSPVVPETSVKRAAPLNITYAPMPAPARRTEQAVTGVAPIKLTRVQRRKPKADPVPAPQ